jgi:RND family efflux transporter MFP subunit
MLSRRSRRQEHALKKATLSLLVAGGAVLAAVVGHASVFGKKSEPLSAEIARAVRRDVGSVVKATGVIRPAIGAEVRVGAQTSGVLRRLHVQIGEPVSKGQLLAELEARALWAKRDQAAAALQAAQADRTFNVSDLARKHRLASERAIPQSELDLAERSLALADAGVAQAKASLAFARAQLDEARILAPISGVVAAISTREGETIAAGPAPTPVLTLIDLQRLEAWAYVDETDIGRISVGQQAHFASDAYPDREIEGQVAAIYPKPEIRDNVVNYVAVVRFSPPREAAPLPEMTANVKITLEKHANVVTVPTRAVRRERGKAFVLRPEGGAVAKRFVTIGRHDETGWEIVEGLREGDAVLLGEAPSTSKPTEP